MYEMKRINIWNIKKWFSPSFSLLIPFFHSFRFRCVRCSVFDGSFSIHLIWLMAYRIYEIRIVIFQRIPNHWPRSINSPWVIYSVCVCVCASVFQLLLLMVNFFFFFFLFYFLLHSLISFHFFAVFFDEVAFVHVTRTRQNNGNWQKNGQSATIAKNHIEFQSHFDHQ